jgi:hypothetical protein
MSDIFVPLSPATLPRLTARTPADPTTVAGAAPSTSFESIMASSADPSRSPDPCAKPTVTLQRNGDVVTGIRIQCGCGRVTDLNCVY